jgi:hypothetical protein
MFLNSEPTAIGCYTCILATVRHSTQRIICYHHMLNMRLIESFKDGIMPFSPFYVSSNLDKSFNSALVGTKILKILYSIPIVTLEFLLISVSSIAFTIYSVILFINEIVLAVSSGLSHPFQ